MFSFLVTTHPYSKGHARQGLSIPPAHSRVCVRGVSIRRADPRWWAELHTLSIARAFLSRRTTALLQITAPSALARVSARRAGYRWVDPPSLIRW